MVEKNNISDQEMLRTFNCGVGFCVITPKKNIERIQKVFPKKYKPYEIGYITNDKVQIKLSKTLKW